MVQFTMLIVPFTILIITIIIINIKVINRFGSVKTEDFDKIVARSCVPELRH